MTGAEMQLIRASLGLSRRAMAELVNVSECSVKCWERGQRNPRPIVLARYRELANARVQSCI